MAPVAPGLQPTTTLSHSSAVSPASHSMIPLGPLSHSDCLQSGTVLLCLKGNPKGHTGMQASVTHVSRSFCVHRIPLHIGTILGNRTGVPRQFPLVIGKGIDESRGAGSLWAGFLLLAAPRFHPITIIYLVPQSPCGPNQIQSSCSCSIMW